MLTDRDREALRELVGRGWVAHIASDTLSSSQKKTMR
jgi:hypothetical protein